ncbi:MAG: hypothetical protein JO323_18715 [Acidobacteriia bacterium]|nr:hypothetical protein [Terriglobia bacterium]
MRKCYLGLLSSLLLMHPMLAAEPGFRAELIGGTLPGVAPHSSFRLDLTATDLFRLRGRGEELNIAYNKVVSIEYGQNVSRPVLAAALVSPVLLLSKSHKHYVTLEYTDAEGNQQALVFQVSKGDIRSVLAGLEARTGRRIEYQDDNARKAGQ